MVDGVGFRDRLGEARSKDAHNYSQPLIRYSVRSSGGKRHWLQDEDFQHEHKIKWWALAPRVVAPGTWEWRPKPRPDQLKRAALRPALQAAVVS